MFALLFVTPQTSPLIIACIIFCEGATSTLIQTPNALTIFCEVPSELKGVGISIYALGKQLSASIGVALSTMLLAIALKWHGYRYSRWAVNSSSLLYTSPLEQYRFSHL